MCSEESIQGCVDVYIPLSERNRQNGVEKQACAAILDRSVRGTELEDKVSWRDYGVRTVSEKAHSLELVENSDCSHRYLEEFVV